MADLEEAKECFVTALRHSASAVSVRVAAGRKLISSQPYFNINKHTPLLLSTAVELSSGAAAIALHANRGPAAAIELLETGRGGIAGALFEQSDLAARLDVSGMPFSVPFLML
ncbi:hypothetical protein EDB80DRAFT_701290 [Ilyonectria destructans]|nr:hypothetical protein EDB80DRAFT_701290 [Ilyonectria destructans]